MTRAGWLMMIAIAASPAAAQDAAPIATDLLTGFRFRSIGPAVTGGRIHDVEALPDDPATVYVATASGGLWKTTNKGTTWTPIFDDQPVSTFGDVAIAPSDPEILYAGTGEQNNRQSTSWGNGVYRSDDGGRTWRHLGLAGTHHIGRVLVHPSNPDVAYVAALGTLWKPSADRGVYRTDDGGRTWRKLLYLDTLTGVVDLVMDPTDPNTLYAAAYQRLRRAWGFNGGGPGSGIHKTTDGGRTWRELTAGIPAGDKGRIGLAIARTNPRVLNATIEHATESGTYRTEDGGATWTRVSRLNPRPMYYSHIFIDPTNADRVYIAATSFYKSEDGGRNFDVLPYRPTYDVGVHSDFHTMWIDPNTPKHFYLAGDGGLHETWDMGLTYEKLNNFAIGQFYAIGADMRAPYWVYGGMQDNHSWMGPSATRHWIGIINDDWRQIGFGDGMYWQPDPTSHRYVYGNAQNGSYTRLDAETGDLLDIRPREPDGEPEYRWDWVSPSLVSRHDPRVLYVGGNRLFISRDRGASWERTEDLTRQIDRDTLRLMGVRGADVRLSRNDGTSSFGEITTITESPLDPAILWVGTDDGNVQVSRDGGRTWTEVARNVRGVRRGAYVSRVLASASGPGTAYATFDAHRDGDFRPYVFRTADFGRTWTPLAQGLPPDGSVNVIVEHPERPSLLVLGTEHALFVSTDAGARWAAFDANLPTTLYDDLLIHPRDHDLVVATHGRSLWILDDVTPLAEWSGAVADATAHLFPVRPAMIFQYWKDTSYRGQAAYAGENPPYGAIVSYHLRSPVPSARLTIVSPRGDTVRALEGPAGRGIHRVVWDLRHEPPPTEADEEGGRGPRALPVPPHPLEPRGPFVSPGTYTVVLDAGDASLRQMIEVLGDSLMPLSATDWQERERFLLDVLALQRAVWDAGERATALRERVVARRDSLRGAGSTVPAELAQRADSTQVLERRLRGLRFQIYGLAGDFNGQGVRQGSLYPPTATQRELSARVERQLTEAAAALARLEQSGGWRGEQ